MLKSVCFISRAAAEMMLPAADTVMISISAPDEGLANIPEGYRSVLRVEFYDLYEEVLGIPVGSLPDACPNEQPVLWKVFHLPDANHALKIFQLIEHHSTQEEPVHLIVHCHAGVSRSAAVAMFVADRYGCPIDNANPDTSAANARLLRLLNKISDGAPLVVGESPDIDALIAKHKKISRWTLEAWKDAGEV